MTALDVAFAAVSLVTAASGLLAVTTRHVVHAALWLVVCLGAVAGCYLVLGAEFVALVQLLVYVGAIVVLVLFALMLTRAPIGANPDISTSRLHRVLAGVLGAGVTALLAAALLPLAGPAVERRDTSTTQLAEQLFGTWVWPFEVLSVLLLVALVAAMAVSRMTRPPVADAVDTVGTLGTVDTTHPPTAAEPAVAEPAVAEPAAAEPAAAEPAAAATGEDGAA